MTKNNSLLLLTKITIIALIVGAIALPSVLEIVSPFWMLIFFIYWIIYSDTKVLYLFALILGLLTDILQGSILGQNALALLISSAFIFSVKKSFYVSNLTTQQVYIFVASIIYLIALILTHITIQGFNFSWLILLSPFTGAIVWPLVRLFLAKLKH
ncbi:rod shape-determining protein MreD [Candidatus Thioglobus sp.]|nr:rod shape-determining protein MreD [Candidatus Thioglobus sp.]